MNKVLTYSPSNAIDRAISNGSEFDIYFPETENKKILVSKSLSTRETVLKMIDVINTKSFQVKEIAKYLEKETIYHTCKNIWNFCYKYIKYQKDIQEELREPAATWRDGQILARQYPEMIREDGVQYGVDCDCYTIFIGSILKELGIPFNIKMTSYLDSLGFDNGFQHVYIIVPQNQNYITVDPVVHSYNYEKPVSRYELFTLSKKIHSTMAEVYVLSGIEGNEDELIAEIYDNSLIDLVTGRNIEGLGFDDEDDEIDLLQYLKTSKIAIQTNPEIITTHNPEDFIKMLDVAINNWDDETKREIALEQLSNMEEYLLQNNSIQLSGIDELDFSDLQGGFFSKVKEKNKATKAAKKAAKTVKKNTKKSAKATKKAIKKTAKTNNKTAKKVAKKNKTKGTTLNKLNKLNPATLAVRNAFRTCIGFNFMGLATILASPEAKSKGILTKVEDLYFKLGGKKEKLNQTIQKAKTQKAIFNKNATTKVTVENDDLRGLGAVMTVAAATTAAAAPLATVITWLNKAGLMKKDTADKAITNIKTRKEKKIAKKTAKKSAKAAKTTKTGFFKKLKAKKTAKKEEKQAIIDSGNFDPRDLNKDGKVSLVEKAKSLKDKTKTVIDNQTSDDFFQDEEVDTTKGKTENQIDDFANSSEKENQNNEETTLKNTIGKFVKEHPVALAVGATVIVGGITLSIPQVRSWLGIGSGNKKLGIIDLS